MNQQLIKECHTIIDQSDPFLVEAITGKSITELCDYITKLSRELETVHPNNINRKTYYQNAITTSMAVLELKQIQENSGDEVGGYSIS